MEPTDYGGNATNSTMDEEVWSEEDDGHGETLTLFQVRSTNSLINGQRCLFLNALDFVLCRIFTPFFSRVLRLPLRMRTPGIGVVLKPGDRREHRQSDRRELAQTSDQTGKCFFSHHHFPNFNLK